MKIEQLRWTPGEKWSQPAELGQTANLVFLFAESALFRDGELVHAVRQCFPKAYVMGCSTAGEISDARVYDDSAVMTAIQFENTEIKTASLHLSDVQGSFVAGEKLAKSLEPKGLTHVFVLSAGLNVNGSELVEGLSSYLPKAVTVTGGLAGDQARFQETFVIAGADVSRDLISVVGFYGANIKICSGSLGGWEEFGPERKVTRSHGNILYELDGKSVLDLYKTFLGDQARELPGSALLFPLNLHLIGSDHGLVRTVLNVDEIDQSMTFAGDIPEGSTVRLMKANFDRLVTGAAGAAQACLGANEASPEFALLISCVGRKLVLRHRVHEEIEAARRIFGTQTVLGGFYSYGEISPFAPSTKCELHNQTMTITTFAEKVSA